MTSPSTINLVVNGTDVGDVTLNDFGRILNGGYYKKPEGATEEMVQTADSVIRTLAQAKLIHGWCGDRSEAFIIDCVNEMLQYFVNFATNKKRIESDIVSVNICKLTRCHDTGALIDKYVALSGYCADKNYFYKLSPLS